MVRLAQPSYEGPALQRVSIATTTSQEDQKTKNATLGTVEWNSLDLPKLCHDGGSPLANQSATTRLANSDQGVRFGPLVSAGFRPNGLVPSFYYSFSLYQSCDGEVIEY
jgi:hypothetical protein